MSGGPSSEPSLPAFTRRAVRAVEHGIYKLLWHNHLERPPRPSLSRVAVLLLAPLWAACAGAPATAEGGEPTAPPAAAPEAGTVTASDALFPAANRPDVRGVRGAVSSDHPLATAVGYEVLRRGGNAVDAAVAMAGVLAVVRPHMNGVGGDVFALFHDGRSGRVTALNGSGRAGALATPDFFRSEGRDGIPGSGAASVTVPGAVAAWVDALERFGSLPLAELLQPAIAYARDGFPVSSRLASDFAGSGETLEGASGDLYLPGGEPPAVGSLLRNRPLAETLERIASQGKAAFYRGEVADRMAAFLRAEGGHVTPADFASHASEWVEPLSGDYLGHRFHVLPPNAQGVAQLQQMEMSKSFDLKEMGHNTSSYLHTLIEVKKRAFADRDRWVADPAHAEIPLEALLDPAYLRRRAGEISPDRAAREVAPGVGEPLRAQGPGEAEAPDDSGDTVYLTAVDQWGNAVSWIQSLFAGFGSGLLDPETGVLFHNRGALFVLTEGHPNRVSPGKRPYHTLTPLLAQRDGRLAFTLGTPGGDSQTQSLLQIVHNLLVFAMTPQEAVEAPRYRSMGGLSVALEDRVPPGVREELEARGHRIRVVRGWTATFGGAQMILVDPMGGTLVAAADPRREAYALAY